MGEVYEAEDLELGQRVALKTLRPEIALDEFAVQRFHREIVTARKVTHPGVCRTFDFFRHRQDEGGEPIAFLTMEFLRGETLADRLAQKGPLDPEEALPLIRQMVAALGAAHRAGVIHRDLKSSNVMLVPRKEGVRVVITDFGLARDTRPTAEEASMTQTGQLVGSPAYIAPEQVEGLEATPRTDLYSLGVVVYEMVTGHRPFEGTSLMSLVARRLREDPPPPSRHRPGLPPRWDRAIVQALARTPEDRFEDAESFLRALELGPGSVGEVASPRRPRWRHELGALLVGALLLAGLVLAWAFFRSKDGVAVARSERPSIAVLHLNNLSRQDDADWLGPALAEMLTSELGVGGKLRTISGELVQRMERDLRPPPVDTLAPDTLLGIQEYLNTNLVVLGSYFKSGPLRSDPLRLDLRIQDTTTGETLATFRETFSEDQILDLVPRLGLEVRRHLGLEPPPAAAVKATLPNTPRAARSYSEGLEHLRGFDLQNATEVLRQAALEDPQHPLILLALGEALWARGSRGEAREQYSQAFEQSGLLPRPERLFVEARYHEAMAHWPEAVERFRTLHEFFPDNVEYGLALGRVLRMSGENSQALVVLDRMRATPVDGRLDPRIEEGRAEAFFQLADYAASMQAAIACRRRAETIGASVFVPRGLRLEGRALWRLGKLEAAQEVLVRSLNLFEEIENPSGVASNRNVLGIIAGEMGLFEEAWEHYEASLAAFRQLGHFEGVQTLLNNLGTISHQRGDFLEAEQRYQEALGLARDLSNDHAVTTYLTNLALLESSLGDVPRALQHAQEALPIAEALDDRIQVLSVHVAMAGLYRIQGDLELARSHTVQAKELLAQDDNPLFRIEVLVEEAQLARIVGDFETARTLLLEAREYHRSTSGDVRLGGSSVLLAALEFEAGNTPSARQELQTLMNQLAASGREADWPSAWMLLAELEAVEGNHTAAQRILQAGQDALEDSQDFGTIAWARALEIWIGASDAAEVPDLRALAALKEQLRKRGLHPMEMEVEILEAEIELRRGSPEAGRRLLVGVEQRARAAGFEVLARKARRHLDMMEPSRRPEEGGVTVDRVPIGPDTLPANHGRKPRQHPVPEPGFFRF